MRMLIRVAIALLATVTLASTSPSQEPFAWNREVPIKKPTAGDNGKLVLFDVSHGGTQGAADWVINGGFSDFADALVAAGFTVGEYRGVDQNNDGIVTFVDDREGANVARNEAFIAFEAIRHADVFVLAETNRPLRVDEYDALKKFVDAGKGIYFVGDHYNADRNLNTWDCTEVFNGYNRSDLAKYDMQPHYGDQRNPRDATKGWLAENFGIRFRFNAVDWKRGASGVIDAEAAEGLTRGAGPVLIAAGATLAIVDPGKAKGLVYFSDDDNPKSWRNAVEGPSGGIYFGGREEGPVAAISKPSRGKAAFIGDSSPIEDNTPRYVREDSGKPKRLHKGWRSPGNAAQLSLNIVEWLATPEDYVGFHSAGHPPGFPTPKPLAPAEKADPDAGDPWKRPSGNYDPWDPNTFAAGSYGAKFAGSGGGTPTGVPITVAGALGQPNGAHVKVVGTVAGAFNDQFGMKLADIDDAGKSLAVQLPAELRDQFSPILNPEVVGKVVVVVGRRNRYANLPGLKQVAAISVGMPSPPVPPRAGDTIGARAAPRTLAAKLRSAASSSVLDPNAEGVFVRVVDVGAGLCCIVKVNDDDGSHYMIYDTGNYENKFNERDAASGVIAFAEIKRLVPSGREIEWVVQSHEDSDHIAATPQICRRYTVKNFLRTGFVKQGDTRKRSRDAILREVAKQGARDWVQRIRGKRMSIGHQFSLGDARITLLSGFGKPLPEWNRVFRDMQRPPSKQINSVSIVLRLDYRGRSILFTGDAVGKKGQSDAAIATEKFLLDNQGQPNRTLKADVLIAAHHGANNASSLPFIEAVRPRSVVFSAGDKHGHPKWATVKRFLSVDSTRFLFRTDLGDRRRGGEWNWRSTRNGNDRAGDDHVDIALTPGGRALTFYADRDKRAFAVKD